MENSTGIGKLYIVSTPIGNLEDITLRALNVLKSVDLIAAEDTRHTRELLSHFDIHAKLVSYHAFNEHGKTSSLLDQVESGLSVASVSDAGTPAIADPGFYLVREAYSRNIQPVVIPGVSALTFAAAASALPVDKFAFWAFPPVKSGRRTAFFERLGKAETTVFFYESPHRMGKVLDEIVTHCGADAAVSIIREATKLHEEILRGPAGELAEKYRNRAWKGEFVIGVHCRHEDSPEEDGKEEI